MTEASKLEAKARLRLHCHICTLSGLFGRSVICDHQILASGLVPVGRLPPFLRPLSPPRFLLHTPSLNVTDREPLAGPDAASGGKGAGERGVTTAPGPKAEVAALPQWRPARAPAGDGPAAALFSLGPRGKGYASSASFLR